MMRMVSDMIYPLGYVFYVFINTVMPFRMYDWPMSDAGGECARLDRYDENARREMQMTALIEMLSKDKTAGGDQSVRTKYN